MILYKNEEEFLAYPAIDPENDSEWPARGRDIAELHWEVTT
jgi:hypothetical protein